MMGWREGGEEGRKDEGIPDALPLRRSEDSDWIYRKSKVRGTVREKCLYYVFRRWMKLKSDSTFVSLLCCFLPYLTSSSNKKHKLVPQLDSNFNMWSLSHGPDVGF